MSSNFVHLHLHTEYSLLDGAIKIKDLINKAKEYNMPAVAITDHGNMYGIIDFYKQAIKENIKPIIGCEVYVAKGSRFNKGKQSDSSEEHGMNHLTLLAKNYEGYKNLMVLTSKAFLEGFYYKPRIDKEILKEYSKGLIALSGCLKGEIAETALLKGEKQASKVIEEYLKIFGEDNFFIEIMENNIPEQKKVNPILIDLAKKYSIGVVATNDCHYLDKTMTFAHDVLLCIQTGKTISEGKRLKFSTDEFYFKSPEKMVEQFDYCPEAIDNTIKISEICNVELEFGKYQFPEVPLEKGETIEDRFEKKSIEGLKERLPEIKQYYEKWDKNIENKYWERLNLEINVIKKMGYCGYFLIVEDFINYAKNNSIPVGPGRGSAAGSLVAYALRITDINPIPYNLLFERFLNPERISMPDIDIDFCNEKRDKVIQYVTEKYGQDKVSQIITFGKMKARAVVRDVGRVLEMPYKEVDKIAKLIPQNLSLKEALENEEELKKLVEKDKNIKKLMEISLILEGLSRHSSKHAAGIVISNKPLTETVPLAITKEGDVVTQYDMKYLEDVGLIKFDFLGLKTLTVIDKAVELVKKRKDKNFDISKVFLEDKKTYKLIASGNTIGVFQLESQGMRELIRRLRPDKFEDVIALVALYRPGPLGSGMVDEFIDVKHGRKKPNYALPQLEPILKDTYGVILYQEQVMQIAQVLAGFTLGEADILRRAMGKKKKEEMAQQRERFLQGCKANKIPLKIAEDIFEKMAKFAEYGFNKSHSAAYAYVAYQTAYLKAHFPVEFMTALLTEDKDNPDKVIKDINECKNMKIEIMPPDVNESYSDFTIIDNKIRFGLGAIKNVGEKAIQSIIENREKKGKFKSLYDFCLRVDLNKVNKKVIESLIKSGAMDSLSLSRAQKFAILEEVLGKAAKEKKERSKHTKSLFGSVGNEYSLENTISIPQIDEWDEEEKLKAEKELLGFYISDHPLTKYKSLLEKYSTYNIDILANKGEVNQTIKLGGIIANIKITRTKKKNEKMANLILEDLTGQIDVMVFPNLYKEYQDILKNDEMIFIKGIIDKQDENDTPKIIANEIIKLEEVTEKFSEKIVIKIANEIEKSKLIEIKKIAEQFNSSNNAHKLYFIVTFPNQGQVKISCPEFSISNVNLFIKKISTIENISAELV